MGIDSDKQNNDLAFIKEIAHGVSTQARFANRLWLSLMLYAFVVLPQMLSPADEIKLPFGIGQIDATVVYCISCPIMAVLLVAFLSAHIQQAKATFFAQRMIDKLSEEKPGNTRISDLRNIYDIMRHPTFIRVSPLPLLAKEKDHFNRENANCPLWLDRLTLTYYLALKSLGLFVYLLLPFLLLIVLFVFYLCLETTTYLQLLVGLFVVPALITSVHALYFEVKATKHIVEKNWPSLRINSAYMEDQIAQVTNSWFDKTASDINDYVKGDSSVDHLLSGMVPLAHNYCNAVFDLARLGRRLPAMALLRVLAELALRTIWCMYKDNPKEELPEDRILRWLKTTNEEEVKFLKRIQPTETAENQKKIEESISYLESELKKMAHKGTGPLYNSLDDLPEPYKKQFYPLLYGRFNQAIHPNLKTLGSLVKREEGKYVLLTDLEEISGEALMIYSMTAAFNILAIVRLHYEWDYEGMKAEYLDTKKQFKEDE